MKLRARPLSAERFAPFGAVVAAEGLAGVRVNEGRGLRFNTGLALAHKTRAAAPTLALYRLQASALPVSVGMLERHPLSAQLFLPLHAGRYLIAVAPALPGGGPDTGAALAFIAEAGQGVLYRPGVWHAPLIALDAASDFAMMMYEDGGPEDCVTQALDAPLVIAAS